MMKAILPLIAMGVLSLATESPFVYPRAFTLASFQQGDLNLPRRQAPILLIKRDGSKPSGSKSKTLPSPRQAPQHIRRAAVSTTGNRSLSFLADSASPAIHTINHLQKRGSGQRGSVNPLLNVSRASKTTSKPAPQTQRPGMSAGSYSASRSASHTPSDEVQSKSSSSGAPAAHGRSGSQQMNRETLAHEQQRWLKESLARSHSDLPLEPQPQPQPQPQARPRAPTSARYATPDDLTRSLSSHRTTSVSSFSSLSSFASSPSAAKEGLRDIGNRKKRQAWTQGRGRQLSPEDPKDEDWRPGKAARLGDL